MLFAVIFANLFALPVFAQGKFPIGTWETWRHPGRIYQLELGPRELYVAAENGVWNWNRFERRWSAPYTIVPSFLESFDLRGVRSIAVTNDNRLIVGTTQGNYIREPVWFTWSKNGGDGEGSIKLDEKTRFTSPAPVDSTINLSRYIMPFGWSYLPDKRVLSPDQRYYYLSGQLEDERGDVWFAVSGVGLLQGSRYNKSLLWNRLGLIENGVQAMAKTKKGWLLGGFSKGLSSFDESTQLWEWSEPEFTGMSATSGNIRSIAPGNRDEFWMATSQGAVYATSLNTRSWRRVGMTEGLGSENALSIVIFGGNAIVGTDAGLDQISSNKKVRAIWRNPSEPVEVRDLVVSGNTLYGASNRGFFQMTHTDSTIVFLDGPEGIASDDWYTVAATANEVWLGGREGVAALDLTSGKWAVWHKYDLDNSYTLSIAPTDSIVWIGTSRGLFRLDRNARGRERHDPMELFAGRIHQYKPSDGLPHWTVYQIQLLGNQVALATGAGFCRFKYYQEGRILE
ncbi:MAG: hypothetical protein OEM52_00985 [bacterium]|nr:hypothetical protein [bacterium]